MAVYLALYYFFGEEVIAQALQDSEFFEDVKDQKHYHFQIWTKTFHENVAWELCNNACIIAHAK